MLKGNDYLLIWLLTEPDGTPIDYNQFDSYKVFIQNDSNKSYKYEVETAALDDGLHFDFKADMQKSTGYYSLIFEAVKDGRNYKAECYRGVHIDGNVDKAQCVVGASNSTIKLTDCLSLYLGGRDGRSPYVGVNNHWWAFDDLQKAYADTGIQVDYSAEIGAQITLAEQAIARVNQTNQTVSENEIARSQNEAIREQEERTRVANEAKRVDDEKVRIANEAKRAEDEAERLSNEASRKNSEAARVNNEAARVSGEDVRVRNEASRTSEESTRVSNENARKSNEITRVNAESSRVSAEQSRVTEEGKRVAAETKRQADTAKAIQDTNTAAQNATDVAAGMEQKIVQIQQNKLDRAEFDLQRQPLYGLGFKSGDNTVNLTTPEINLGLNDFTVEIWARMEGSTNNEFQVFGGSKSYQSVGSLRTGGFPTGYDNNGIAQIQTEVGALSIGKKDSTKNLHHIVITRQGTLVTATINGRLIKSVTQDRVLDFSKFVFDIANTTYFSIGRVFNYAMSQEEAVGLWNGGRVDEVVLGDYLLKSIIADGTRDLSLWKWSDAIATFEKISNQHYKLSVEKRGGFAGIRTAVLFNMNTNNKLVVNVKFSYKSTHDITIQSSQRDSANRVTLPASSEFAEANLTLYYNKIGGTGDIAIASISDGQVLEVKDFNIRQGYCLLELLPQNIHSSGVYNTGSLGSSHDAVLSKPTETTFIKEKPYKDKQMSTGAPNFHPIAMGQKVYSDTGLIYEAAIPPTSREWSTADWKQVNNN